MSSLRFETADVKTPVGRLTHCNVKLPTFATAVVTNVHDNLGTALPTCAVNAHSHWTNGSRASSTRMVQILAVDHGPTHLLTTTFTIDDGTAYQPEFPGVDAGQAPSPAEDISAGPCRDCRTWRLTQWFFSMSSQCNRAHDERKSCSTLLSRDEELPKQWVEFPLAFQTCASPLVT